MKLAGKVALQKSYQAHKFWYELLPPLLKSYFSFTANWSKLKTGSRLVTTRYQGRNRFSTPQWLEVPPTPAFLGVGPIGFWLPRLALFPVAGFCVAGLCSCLSSVFSPLPWFPPPFSIFVYLYTGY